MARFAGLLVALTFLLAYRGWGEDADANRERYYVTDASDKTKVWVLTTYQLNGYLDGYDLKIQANGQSHIAILDGVNGSDGTRINVEALDLALHDGARTGNIQVDSKDEFDERMRRQQALMDKPIVAVPIVPFNRSEFESALQMAVENSEDMLAIFSGTGFTLKIGGKIPWYFDSLTKTLFLGNDYSIGKRKATVFDGVKGFIEAMTSDTALKTAYSLVFAFNHQGQDYEKFLSLQVGYAAEWASIGANTMSFLYTFPSVAASVAVSIAELTDGNLDAALGLIPLLHLPASKGFSIVKRVAKGTVPAATDRIADFSAQAMIKIKQLQLSAGSITEKILGLPKLCGAKGTSLLLRKVFCFPAGTPVLGVNGSIPIEQVRLGDLVRSYDEASGQGRVSTITNVQRKIADKLIVLKLTDGNGGDLLRCTSDHPFLVERNGLRYWGQAGDLRIGDILVSHNGEGIAICEKYIQVGDIPVYSLSADNTPDYFVGRYWVCVHNSKCLVKDFLGSAGVRGFFERIGNSEAYEDFVVLRNAWLQVPSHRQTILRLIRRLSPAHHEWIPVSMVDNIFKLAADGKTPLIGEGTVKKIFSIMDGVRSPTSRMKFDGPFIPQGSKGEAIFGHVGSGLDTTKWSNEFHKELFSAFETSLSASDFNHGAWFAKVSATCDKYFSPISSALFKAQIKEHLANAGHPLP